MSVIELTGDLGLDDRVINILEAPQSEMLDSKIAPWQIRSFGMRSPIED